MTTTLTATLAFAALNAPDAGAAAITNPDPIAVQSYSYQTFGTISNYGSGAPINFVGLTGTQSLTTPGTVLLGQFNAPASLPATATLTYNHTPFDIVLSVAATPGTAVSNGSNYLYEITGNLNGTINGVGGSNMVATITSVLGVPITSTIGTMTTPPFPITDLQIGIPQGINAPNSSDPTKATAGVTNLYTQIGPGLGLPAPAPEPASIAIFGTALVAWGLRRRMIRSKSRASA